MARVFWVLIGSVNTPSSRIHGSRVHAFLQSRGWLSYILFQPKRWLWDPPIAPMDFRDASVITSEDVVIFQKVRGVRVQSALRSLRSIGATTIYLDCDEPPKLIEANLAAVTVCTSRQLAAAYSQSGVERVTYIPDAYEWEYFRRAFHDRRELRVGWFGNVTPEKWATVCRLRSVISQRAKRWRMLVVSDHPKSNIIWTLGDAWKVLARCDAVVIPGDRRMARTKSSNRAIQAMALGVPVLACPSPSYLEVVEPGRTGFICCSASEWAEGLRVLEDPDRRKRMSRDAFYYARRYFSIDRVGERWLALFRELGLRGGTQNCAKDSVVVQRIEHLQHTLRMREMAWRLRVAIQS